MTNAAMNTHLIFLCRHVFNFPGHLPRRVTAGTYGNSVFTFLGDCQAIFLNSSTTLHSYQQCIGLQFVHVLVKDVSPFDDSHLVDVKWWLTEVLIYILLTNDAECLSKCLLAICILFGDTSIQIIFPLKNWVVFLLLICKCSLYTLECLN